jgi:lipid A ethanolaminephosphotransferase
MPLGIGTLFETSMQSVVKSLCARIFRANGVSREVAIVLVALWISGIVNFSSLGAFYYAPSAGEGLTRLVFVFGGFTFLFSTVYTLLLLGAALFWGSSVKVWCSFVVLAAASLSYFSFFFGTQFDKNMLLNGLQTDPAEVLDLLTLRMFLWVLVLGVVPAYALVRVRFVQTKGWFSSFRRSLGLLLFAFALTLIIVYSLFPRYASATRNRDVTFNTMAPVNLAAAAASLTYALQATAVTRAPVGEDAKQSYTIPKPRLIVFVMGETARAQNHGLNGYERDTTARMKAANGFYFPDTESCGTATSISVPCMFSGFSKDEFTLAKGRSIETLIDVVHRAGARVLWRDNDSGCKGVCAKAEYEDFTTATNPVWCKSTLNCFDEILLEGLEQKIRLKSRDTLVVLHLKGSHGPAYYRRYPSQFERFKPTCQTNDLAACNLEEIRNAYDNTIVYTDHVIGETIVMLEKLADQFATALLYVSDHGESLGEGGLFLHGIPQAVAPKEQTRVPMYAWVSPQYIAYEKWNLDCMRKQTQIPRSHHNVYSTVLGFLEIDTKVYKESLDIFEPCD